MAKKRGRIEFRGEECFLDLSDFRLRAMVKAREPIFCYESPSISVLLPVSPYQN